MKSAVRDAGPVPFLAVRFGTAALVMAPFVRRRPTQAGAGRAGAACGLVLLTGYVFQTIGLQYTTSSISAFVTYLLVPIVPVLSAVALRRPPTTPVIVAVVLATAGLFLLTGAHAAVGRGPLLTLGCAFFFAVHVVLLAELSPRFDSVRLHATQLVVVSVGCFLPGLVLGGYRFTTRAWLAALYTGVAVSGVAIFLQVWAQQRVGPTRTALLLALEPVFAAVVGYATGDRLGATGFAGALLILAAVLVAEVAPSRRIESHG